MNTTQTGLRGGSTAVDACPVPRRCGYHRRAEDALLRQDTNWLRDHLDVLDVLMGRAWVGCTCALYNRVVAFLHGLSNRPPA